jgi:hypothetical protein
MLLLTWMGRRGLVYITGRMQNWLVIFYAARTFVEETYA